MYALNLKASPGQVLVITPYIQTMVGIIGTTLQLIIENPETKK